MTKPTLDEIESLARKLCVEDGYEDSDCWLRVYCKRCHGSGKIAIKLWSSNGTSGTDEPETPNYLMECPECSTFMMPYKMKE